MSHEPLKFTIFCHFGGNWRFRGRELRVRIRRKTVEREFGTTEAFDLAMQWVSVCCEKFVNTDRPTAKSGEQLGLATDSDSLGCVLRYQ